MDGTLIAPKSGAKFPKSRQDWQWWDDCVPAKLQQLFRAGHKIVIFSNQGGVEKNKQVSSRKGLQENEKVAGKGETLAIEVDAKKESLSLLSDQQKQQQKNTKIQ